MASKTGSNSSTEEELKKWREEKTKLTNSILALKEEVALLKASSISSKTTNSASDKRLVIKVYHEITSEVHRFVYPYPQKGIPKKDKVTFPKLRRKVKTAFHFPNVQAIILTYVDKEGDKVTLTNDLEFRDAIEFASSPVDENAHCMDVMLIINVNMKKDKKKTTTKATNKSSRVLFTDASTTTTPMPSAEQEILKLKDMLITTCATMQSTADIVANMVRYVEHKERAPNYFKSGLFTTEDESDEMPTTSYASDDEEEAHSCSAMQHNHDNYIAASVDNVTVTNENLDPIKEEKEKDRDSASIKNSYDEGLKHSDNDTDDGVLV
ncbi:hypothetical protein EC973_001515 [Apophysomyces ossiformis]|uniref:PB1 domain-containing protein n=1 Tax=Apophysomyces ossiformis TaxID=679940 RepID=A0A8H7BPY1_9FUNG|nr:hypothetical protein EC973_001515 [Apophysomyces ossiformis]